MLYDGMQGSGCEPWSHPARHKRISVPFEADLHAMLHSAIKDDCDIGRI